MPSQPPHTLSEPDPTPEANHRPTSSQGQSSSDGEVPHLGLFFPVLWAILFQPVTFFSALRRRKFPWDALSFAGFCAMLVPAMQQALAHGLPYLFETLLPDTVPLYLLAPLLEAPIPPETLMLYMALLSIAAVLLLPLYGLVLHLLLFLAQAGERGYGITLQCLCFGSAAWLLRAVPTVGNFLAPLVWLFVMTIALKCAHQSRLSHVLPVMALHTAGLLLLARVL